MRRTRGRALSGGLALALVVAASTACAAPEPVETPFDFEAWTAGVEAATQTRATMAADPPGPEWDARVLLPEAPGWALRTGCELWLAAVSCRAWAGGGTDFDAMLDAYADALEADGWSRYDDEPEVVGQELWTYVRADEPNWTLHLVSTGDYEGQLPELLVHAVLDAPAQAAASPGAGLQGTAGVFPGAPSDDGAVPWGADGPGLPPDPGAAAEFCTSDVLLGRCLARARSFPAYGSTLLDAGWIQQGSAGGALTAFRDPERGDSVVYLETTGQAAEIRAFYDANGTGS